MKSYDYNAIIINQCTVVCADCVPGGILEDDYTPIFADSEVSFYPVCEVCGEIHDYMNKLPDYDYSGPDPQLELEVW